jgi:hypothetical protein
VVGPQCSRAYLALLFCFFGSSDERRIQGTGHDRTHRHTVDTQLANRRPEIDSRTACYEEGVRGS